MWIASLPRHGVDRCAEFIVRRIHCAQASASLRTTALREFALQRPGPAGALGDEVTRLQPNVSVAAAAGDARVDTKACVETMPVAPNATAARPTQVS